MIYVVERKRAADPNQVKSIHWESSAHEEIRHFGPYDDEEVARAVARSMGGIGPHSASRMSAKVLQVEQRDPQKYIKHCIKMTEAETKERKASHAAFVKSDKKYIETLKAL